MCSASSLNTKLPEGKKVTDAIRVTKKKTKPVCSLFVWKSTCSHQKPGTLFETCTFHERGRSPIIEFEVAQRLCMFPFAISSMLRKHPIHVACYASAREQRVSTLTSVFICVLCVVKGNSQ